MKFPKICRYKIPPVVDPLHILPLISGFSSTVALLDGLFVNNPRHIINPENPAFLNLVNLCWSSGSHHQEIIKRNLIVHFIASIAVMI